MAIPRAILLAVLLALAVHAAQAQGLLTVAADLLEEGRRHTEFVRLLRTASAWLDISVRKHRGITVFAPTTDAFRQEPEAEQLETNAGDACQCEMEAFSSTADVALRLQFVKAQFLGQVLDVPGLLKAGARIFATMALGPNGPLTLNVFAMCDDQVSVSTDLVSGAVGEMVHSDSLLTVVSVDKVLMQHSILALVMASP